VFDDGRGNPVPVLPGDDPANSWVRERWGDWATRLNAGWATGSFGPCIRCDMVTIVRNPEGQPLHVICPRDLPSADELYGRRAVEAGSGNWALRGTRDGSGDYGTDPGRYAKGR